MRPRSSQGSRTQGSTHGRRQSSCSETLAGRPSSAVSWASPWLSARPSSPEHSGPLPSLAQSSSFSSGGDSARFTDYDCAASSPDSNSPNKASSRGAGSIAGGPPATWRGPLTGHTEGAWKGGAAWNCIAPGDVCDDGGVGSAGSCLPGAQVLPRWGLLLRPWSLRPAALDSQVNAPGRPGFLFHYMLGTVLGRGGYGVVHSCVHLKSRRAYAVKVIPKSLLRHERDLRRARMEFALQRSVTGHAHIARAEELFEDSQALYLVMEKCEGGDLFEFLSLLCHGMPLCEASAAALFRQLVLAVRTCHEAGLLHRDLKLENVLVQEANYAKRRSSSGVCCHLRRIPTLKLGDFGSALPLLSRGHASVRGGGSRMYQAPEVLNGHPYGLACDMWSLGVILYSLLSGSFPFTAPSESLLTGMIKRGVYHFSGERWRGVSREAKHLVVGLLQVEPSRRASIGDVLSHSWMAPRDMQKKHSKHPCTCEEERASPQ